MSRKLARQSLFALAVLVSALMMAGLGLAGRQAYATESGEGSPIKVTFQAGDGGTVGPEENLVQTFSSNDKGEVAAVTATPSDGYVFVDWKRDGVEVSTSATFAPAKETATYVASFKAADSNDSASANAGEVDLDSNPDHLTGPEQADGTIDESVYPEVDFGSSVSPSRLLGMRLMALPTASTHPTEPGQVVLSKTATPVDGMVNTWDVSVRVEGKDTTKTSDVVLVIDRSGSMKDNNRMVRAKEAAKKFVSTLLPDGNDGNTRIAIVSFASDVTTNQSLTHNVSSLNNAIENLQAKGGTFTQAGIKQAEAILANSNADVKNIVILSDGEPTYSYDITNAESHLALTENGYYETSTNIPQSAFNYRSHAGGGTNMFTFGGRYNGRYWYYNHGNSTIAESTIAKNAGYTMWTVAVNAGDTGKSVLSQCATDDTHAKSTEDPTELAKIFTEIAGNIKAAVQDAKVSDPMGAGFTIPAGSVSNITASQGTATYNAGNKTINWEIGTLSNTIDGDSTVRYAQLTYRIEIDDTILTATPEPDGKSYKTNGETVINYKDATGADQTGEFVSPTVDPVLLVVQKKLYDKNNNEVTNSDQTFSVNVKGDAKSREAYDQTYTLKPGDRKVLTNLRWEDTYTATETGYPDGKSKDDYTTEVKVGDDVTNTFTVNYGDDDKNIVVTNREQPTLTLSKTVTGGLADKTKEFTFNVTVKRGDQTVIDNKTYTLKDGDSKTIAPDSGALLPGDQVTITEANGDGYTTTYKVGDASEQNGSEASFSLSGDTTVSFTNSKPPVPITGLDGNEGIPILPAVLGVGTITAVLCVATTRRHGVRGE
ncbi:Mg-chelatase subunit ChlD [Olsenella sp. KH3B4]|uniref:vWA domain-containing protein n=1 Tax=Olsenella sp. KH3B4 TaxID=1855394 RepID=UPI0008D893EF|nr:VWA domain-containing protein [Olsenella sp. KH3B4]SET09216.1 Mg-chelatase subunit ChlD [Olsenella sp. KH3B4]